MDPTFDPDVNSVPASSADQSAVPNLYKDVERYAWSEDSTFLAGLASILSSQSPRTDPAQLEMLALQVRCFYYNRQNNVAVEPVAYAAWRKDQDAHDLSQLLPNHEVHQSASITNGVPPSVSLNNNNNTESTASDRHLASSSAADLSHETQSTQIDQHSQTASFADIVALIQSGQPIPGIRDIPDTVLTGQGSDATQAPRRKPWEQVDAST